MVDRPYTFLSCCVSLDGYLDDATEHRLLLSTEEDLERIDALRGTCDAIMVGAATVRNDNPQLLVHSQQRREGRVARGEPSSPRKVTVTRTGRLDAGANFFVTGDAEKFVYCASMAVVDVRRRLGSVATVVDAGEVVDLRWVSEDLHCRGVRRLMVEGGGVVLTQFLTAGLADELQLVIAPFFVGDSRAVRMVNDGAFPWKSDRRAVLAEVRRLGDLVLMRYSLSERFGTA